MFTARLGPTVGPDQATKQAIIADIGGYLI
jgi:hypothetical protein